MSWVVPTRMLGKSSSSPFRQDINGLRAIAVLIVVFFHFGVGGLRGGFIGVDEFFVISGFLMTQIISNRIQEGRFSLLDFYASRARRIIPALIAMTVSVLAFGYFWLDSVDYLILGKHAATSLTFTSNFLYYREAGYFDLASHDKWLLHTWSLSVEWQFYLLFPLCLLFLTKFRRGSLFVKGILVALASSLLLSLFLTPRQQPLAFFLLPTRGWELLTGSVCHLYLKRFSPVPKWLWAMGLSLVTIPAFFYSEHLAYPGYWAIAPVLGSAVVILGNGYSKILGAKPIQFFGNISYSLYLWHWPLLLGARYFGLELSPLNITLLFSLSVTCAYMSYVLVEGPFRKGTLSSGRSLVGAVAVLGILAAGATLVWYQRGLPGRLPASAVVAANEALDKNPREAECFIESRFESLPECRIGSRSQPISAALWGDSHSLAILSAVEEALTKAGRSGSFYGMSGCPPLLGTNGFRGRPQCAEFNEKSARRIVENRSIRDVFVVSRWSEHAEPRLVSDFEFPAASPEGHAFPALPSGASSYFRRIRDTLCMLSASGKRVFALAPIPEMNVNVPRQLARTIVTHIGTPNIGLSMAQYTARHHAVLTALRAAERQCGVQVVYPSDVLCDHDWCAGVRDGRPIYYDTHHLSEFGNRALIPLFIAALGSAREPEQLPPDSVFLQDAAE